MTAVNVTNEQLLEQYTEQKIGTFIFIMIIYKGCCFKKNADIFVCFSGCWLTTFSNLRSVRGSECAYLCVRARVWVCVCVCARIGAQNAYFE